MWDSGVIHKAESLFGYQTACLIESIACIRQLDYPVRVRPRGHRLVLIPVPSLEQPAEQGVES